jgi:hypothetical protein
MKDLDVHVVLGLLALGPADGERVAVPEASYLVRRPTRGLKSI